MSKPLPDQTTKQTPTKADDNLPKIDGTAPSPNSNVAAPQMKPRLRLMKMKPRQKDEAAPTTPTCQPLPKIHRILPNLPLPKQPKKACVRHGSTKLKPLQRPILIRPLPRRAAMKLRPRVNLPQNLLAGVHKYCQYLLTP